MTATIGSLETRSPEAAASRSSRNSADSSSSNPSANPNLATRCMGLALRQVQGHFEGKYGYRPLLAESFSDPEHHEGTIYKASNWTPLGYSKGFKRHKSDYYTDEKSPKKYWIYPLQKNAQELLKKSGPFIENATI